MLENVVFGALALVMVGGIMFNYRIVLIFEYWKRASLAITSNCRRLIDEGKYDQWQHLWDDFDKTYGSYGKQILMLNKWTFKDFYPDLAE